MSTLESRHHRTLIRITAILPGDFADAVLPGWNTKEVVSVNLGKIPIEIRTAIRERFASGSDAIRTFVYANLGAERAEDLHLKDWELPPEDPPDDWLT